jgi:hypothetical protein
LTGANSGEILPDPSDLDRAVQDARVLQGSSDRPAATQLRRRKVAAAGDDAKSRGGARLDAWAAPKCRAQTSKLNRGNEIDLWCLETTASMARLTVVAERSPARRHGRTKARRCELKAPAASSGACSPPGILHGDWKAVTERVHGGGTARVCGDGAELER